MEGTGDRRDLHSFPTRRSSDLFSDSVAQKPIIAVSDGMKIGRNAAHVWNFPFSFSRYPRRGSSTRGRRSEEHTSELQSRFDLVCRLLLEKKQTTATCNRSGRAR